MHSGDFQGINGKINHFRIKLNFGSNSPYITYLFLYFTGELNIEKSSIGTSMECLRDPVTGHPGG